MVGGRIPKPAVLLSVERPSAMRIPRRELIELVEFVGLVEGAGLAQVDLAVVGSLRMADLNRRYLRHRGPTDVLSFDLSEQDRTRICAQLIICADVAVRQAKRYGTSARRELLLYVVHGLLHLLGYDDSTSAGSARMRQRQEQILRDFLRRRRCPK